jgi:hypothetical protein
MYLKIVKNKTVLRSKAAKHRTAINDRISLREHSAAVHFACHICQKQLRRELIDGHNHYQSPPYSALRRYKTCSRNPASTPSRDRLLPDL